MLQFIALSTCLRDLQFPLDFFVVFLQFFLREFLNWPFDDQTALIRFTRLGDYVEVDVRNNLGED